MLLFWDRVSLHSPGRPWDCPRLTSASKCWDYRQAPGLATELSFLKLEHLNYLWWFLPKDIILGERAIRPNKMIAFLHPDYINNFAFFCVPSSLSFGFPPLSSSPMSAGSLREGGRRREPRSHQQDWCCWTSFGTEFTSWLHFKFTEQSQEKHKEFDHLHTRSLAVVLPPFSVVAPPPLLWSAILKFIPRTLFPGMAMLRQREEIRPSEALSSDVRDPRRSYRCCNVGLSWTRGLICMEQLVYFLSPCHAVEQSMVLAGPLYHAF